MEKHKHKSKVKVKKVVLWQAATVILAIALIYMFSTGGNCSTGASGAVSADEAGDTTVDFISNVLLEGAKEATLKNVSAESNMYKVEFEVDGQSYPSYVSTDGRYLFLQAIDMDVTSEEPAQEAGPEITQTARPEIELHIFSYCPAGSSSLDSFAPVGKALKDQADFKVRFFSDMHGEYEKQQNIIQACIQDVDYDNYWDYADVFYERIYTVCGPSRDIDCDKNKSIDLMDELGIDSEAVMACVDEKGEELYAADKARAGELQLRYSPSFVINDVYLSKIQRSPEGIKTAVCSAFTEAPAECSAEMSNQAQSSGSC